MLNHSKSRSVTRFLHSEMHFFPEITPGSEPDPAFLQTEFVVTVELGRFGVF
jgi:hypothetical protein